MNTVISPIPPVILPVAGSESGFPVRRVYCVGQNYAEHAAEMGADGRQPPFFLASRRMLWCWAVKWLIRR